ncbi:MAG: bifunctional oligoribonuclease/PAP phosphatase NrnA [Candidatus Spechtbacterales bacterium]
MSQQLKDKFVEAKRIIEDSEHILLAGHMNPDGDSLGSVLGLRQAIEENLGKSTTPYLAGDPLPESLNFLPGCELLRDSISQQPDLIIGFDYGDFARLGIPEDVVEGTKIITFDHHPESAQRGDVKIIETDFSSTTEIVYSFLLSAGWHVSQKTALCLLTGILTDTGFFAHNTSARTLKTAGELLDRGASLHMVHSKTFAGKSSEVLNVWGNLLQKMQKDSKYNFSYTLISFDEFVKYGIVLDDLTGLISIMNNAHETGFSVLAVEYERGKIKGSLRSDKFKDVDVSRIAQKLGGGGHKYAAGFNLECSLEDARNKIYSAVEEVLIKNQDK